MNTIKTGKKLTHKAVSGCSHDVSDRAAIIRSQARGLRQTGNLAYALERERQAMYLEAR